MMNDIVCTLVKAKENLFHIYKEDMIRKIIRKNNEIDLLRSNAS